MASLEELRNERIKKLNHLKEKGINPYPIKSSTDFSLGEAVVSFGKLLKKKQVTLAGRVMAVRGQGAIVFFDLNDGTGTIQGMLKKGETKSGERFLAEASAIAKRIGDTSLTASIEALWEPGDSSGSRSSPST